MLLSAAHGVPDGLVDHLAPGYLGLALLQSEPGDQEGAFMHPAAFEPIPHILDALGERRGYIGDFMQAGVHNTGGAPAAEERADGDEHQNQERQEYLFSHGHGILSSGSGPFLGRQHYLDTCNFDFRKNNSKKTNIKQLKIKYLYN
jgi:hypothetical protein